MHVDVPAQQQAHYSSVVLHRRCVNSPSGWPLYTVHADIMTPVCGLRAACSDVSSVFQALVSHFRPPVAAMLPLDSLDVCGTCIWKGLNLAAESTNRPKSPVAKVNRASEVSGAEISALSPSHHQTLILPAAPMPALHRLHSDYASCNIIACDPHLFPANITTLCS